VILFMLIDGAPLVLVVTLIALLYLTWLELHSMPVRRKVKLWWYLLVFLTHAFGYLALRLWSARRQATA
jgi:uncharacterized RDD family membrane protein YckC